jgi:hypothetical protein
VVEEGVVEVEENGCSVGGWIHVFEEWENDLLQEGCLEKEYLSLKLFNPCAAEK